MSDETTDVVDDKGGNSGFTPPATQEELNRIIADRISREKAKFSDYNDLKAKASEFDKLADAQKSETQKALERAEAAERALSAKESEALRLSVIARHNIPADYQEFVSGSDEAELEAKAVKVLSLVPQPDSTGGARELFLPGEGRSPANALNGDPLLEALKRNLGIA